MIAIIWILVGLICFDVIAHLRHITLLSELKNDIDLLRNKIDGGNKVSLGPQLSKVIHRCLVDEAIVDLYQKSPMLAMLHSKAKP